ncbi:hypothetical protein [Burkholderia anthina]|uniref:hypothetical protein n=1 Tax=Burkholderia anthina TaxID=179879 RepID=UPI003C7B7AC9
MEIPELDTDTGTRDGASVVLETARDHGVDICFANPGTTEMPFVVALDRVTGVRPILNIVGDHARDHLKYDAPLTFGVATPALV